jgi:hypothetical protein
LRRGRSNIKPRLAELSAERAAILNLPWTDVDLPMTVDQNLVSLDGGDIACVQTCRIAALSDFN